MSRAKKVSGERKTKKKPKQWDKMVSAAYLRILGRTQKETAESVGRSERTIRDWESLDKDRWNEARREAESRWLQDATDASRRSVLRGVERNPDMGFRFLERVDPALAPPKQKLEHSGEDGGPIEVAVTHRVIDPSED